MLCVGGLTAQLNLMDDRYGNQLAPLPPYLAMNYDILRPIRNENINSNTVPVAGDGLIDEFGQCGGVEWEGPKACRANLVCLKRSKYYSQCLSSEAASVATRPVPQALPPGSKCHGGNLRGPISCAVGTACFIQTEHIHGECRASCPHGWFCTHQTLPEWAPCGGESYVGLTKCKEGLHCVPHSRWYHECRSECPEGWNC